MSDIIQIVESKNKLDLNSLHHKYYGNGLSLRQISKVTFHSKSTVANCLKKNGFKLRRPCHHHGNPSQLKFGFKKSNKGLEESESEKRVILLIKELKDEGLTYREIAKRMMAFKIPSKNGKKNWHPMMVKRIYSELS